MDLLNFIRIGTSGWHYLHWKGIVYDKKTPTKQLLKAYTEKFTTVEINNSFYRLPSEENLIHWRNTVPPGFIFSMKASQYMTHFIKLKNAEASIELFFNRIQLLEDHLGPVVFQLPPRWKLNLERLASFIPLLPKQLRYAFEFREKSWFDPRVLEILRQHHCGFCIYDLAHEHSPFDITTDFIYMRLHGPGSAYQGSYTMKQLIPYANFIKKNAKEGRKIYCYFDNEEAGYAAKNAKSLMDLILEG